MKIDRQPLLYTDHTALIFADLIQNYLGIANENPIEILVFMNIMRQPISAKERILFFLCPLLLSVSIVLWVILSQRQSADCYVYFRSATEKQEHGKFVDAEQDYRKAIKELAPEDYREVRVWWRLRDTLKAQNKFKEAEIADQEAKKLYAIAYREDCLLNPVKQAILIVAVLIPTFTPFIYLFIKHRRQKRQSENKQTALG